jgi:2-hydroxychromene-2-carboxylate isomerase
MPKQVEFFYDFTSPTAYLAGAACRTCSRAPARR